MVSFAILYAMLSLGLNMQWGFTGLPNFGYHAFFAIGAYCSAMVTLAGFPITIGFLIGMIMSLLAAALLGVSTLKLRGDYFFIGSLMFGEIIWNFINNEYWLTNGPLGLYGIPHLLGQTGGVFTVGNFLIEITSLFIMYTVIDLIVKSPYGRVLKAMREDEVVCKAVGKNTFHYRLQCFYVSAMIASFAGSFYAHYVCFIAPETFTIFVTFYVFICLLIGGLGSNKGALIGAFIVECIYDGLRFLGDLTGGVFATQLASVRVMLIGFILVLIIKVRPRGIFGEK